jgi:opacity protein-like surface antigen
MRQVFLAAFCVAFCVGKSATAADFQMPVTTPVVMDDWSGFYVGAEAGYGWGRQRLSNTFDAGAINPFDTGTTFSESVNCFPDCETISSHSRVYLPNMSVPLADVQQQGWRAGAFFGAQKQWGSLVLGLEADIDGANVKGGVSTARTSTQTLDAAIITDFSVSGCLARTNDAKHDLSHEEFVALCRLVIGHFDARSDQSP